MAYLDLDLDHAPLPTGLSPAAEVAALFSPVEESVISIGLDDPISSRIMRKIIAPTIEALFGLASPNRLADARLETLRRYLIDARTRLEQADRQGMREADFTHEQCAPLDARFASRNPAPFSRWAKLSGLAANIGTTLWGRPACPRA